MIIKIQLFLVYEAGEGIRYTGFPNKDARLLVGTVFTTWTIFSEL